MYLVIYEIITLVLIFNEKDVVDNSAEKLLSHFFMTRQSYQKKIRLQKVIDFIKDGKNAEDLNIFFSNAVKHLKIQEREEVSPLVEKLSHPILEAIFKYSKHRSIIAINNVTNGWTFQFSCVRPHISEIKKTANWDLRENSESTFFDD